MRDDDENDDGDDDDGYPAYSHQSYSNEVGICRNDKGWEYDTVKFPPYPCIMISIAMRGGWCVWSEETSGTPQAPSMEACLKVYFVRLVQTPLKSLNLPQFEATTSLRISKCSFGK